MQHAEIEWERLHDATLVDLTTEWESGETRARLRLSKETAVIEVTGSTLLRCPRERPWGPSVSINEVRIRSLPEGRKRVEIEVQSGDVIEIEGDAVRLSVAQ